MTLPYPTRTRSRTLGLLPSALAVMLLVFTGCEFEVPVDPGTDLDAPSVDVAATVTPVEGPALVIGRVAAEQDGFIVLHRTAEDGGPVVPASIGHAAVAEGANVGVRVSLDEPVSDGEQLWAMLHVDSDNDGVYEFNGPGTEDGPVTVDGEIVQASFVVDQVDPALTVEDQVLANGTVTVPQADVPVSGWAVIHIAAESGGPGAVIGQTFLEAGANMDVSVALDSSVTAGDTLYAMLHYDTGTEGVYEFAGPGTPDQPIRDADGVVTLPFAVLGASDADVGVTVDAQDASDAEVVIGEVVAPARGFIVIHNSDANGNIIAPASIGHTAVFPGTNMDVTVSLDEAIPAGSTLYAMLHFDDGTVGVYEFGPGSTDVDTPVTVNGNVVVTPFSTQ